MSKNIRPHDSFNTAGFKRYNERVCCECCSPYMGKGNSKYCSKLCSSRNEYETNMLKPEWRLGKLLGSCKFRATSKGLPFDLTKEYLLGLWDGSSGKCQVTGIPLDLTRAEVGKVAPYAPSIDRIVPSLGYVQGNVRVVCYQLNVALSEFGLEQFDNFVNLYIKNRVAFR